jgi:hypothetical protein
MQHPKPRTPADLSRHRCIRSRLPSDGIYRWEFERHGEALAIDGEGPLILDEPNLMLAAAASPISPNGMSRPAHWFACWMNGHRPFRACLSIIPDVGTYLPGFAP